MIVLKHTLPRVTILVPSMIEMYLAGKTCIEVANKLGVSHHTVLRYLRLNGVKIKSRADSKQSSLHPKWKGNQVGIGALHSWVKRHLPKSDLCQLCGLVPPVDLANIADKPNPETYTRDLANWEWLCRRCHMTKDGRIEKLRTVVLRKKLEKLDSDIMEP